MGCLLGCFGGRKKERNHGSSPLIANKQKVPHSLRHISPARNLAASSASGSIPIKAATGYENLLTVRQALKSGPVRSAGGILLQGHKTPQEQNEHMSADPWSQLDDLEEELEDLRKQIDKESDDARKIREEVHFLKSCGTLQKTPSELRKRAHHSEGQQIDFSGNQWHSWLVPSYSPNANAMVAQCSKLQADSCTLTPANESHGFLDRVHTPTVSKSSPIRILGSLQSAARPDANTAVNLEEKTEIAINMSGDCRMDDTAKERTAQSFIAIEETKEPKPSIEETEANTTFTDVGSQLQRLGFLPSNKDKDSHLWPASTNLTHVFRSVTLPPILESRLSMEEVSTSDESERFCKEDKISTYFPVDKHGNKTPATTSLGTISQGSSLSSGHNYATTRPIIGSKSVSFTDSYADNDTTDGYTYGDTAESSYSSYSNSSCIQTGEGSCTANDSYSSSTIGEELMSDGTCFPTSQTQQERYPFTKYVDSSGTSSVNTKSEDNFDSFSDAMSHVSTASSSEKEKGSKHGHADCTDIFSSQTPSFAHASDLCSLKTPKSLPAGLVTPTLTMQGLHARPRSKPTSSVLMPVENVSQWKELKQRSDYPDLGTSNSGISTSPVLVRRNFDYATQDAKDTSGENRSKLPMHVGEDDLRTSEIPSEICVDTSLSHWLKPLSQKEATETSRSSDSRSIGADTCSPAPPSTAGQTPMQWHRSASRYSTDRPILGDATADYSATAKKRPQWDGKGIPNTTTKYKEDQTVNWHGTPFEVRLERALDKQGLVLQKKLFGVTSSTT